MQPCISITHARPTPQEWHSETRQNVSQPCIFWHVLPWHNWQMMVCMVKQQGLNWAEVSRRRGRERDALSGSNEVRVRQLWGDKGLSLPTAQRHHSAARSHTFHFACFCVIYTPRQIGHGNNAQQELFTTRVLASTSSPCKTISSSGWTSISTSSKFLIECDSMPLVGEKKDLVGL